MVAAHRPSLAGVLLPLLKRLPIGSWFWANLNKQYEVKLWHFLPNRKWAVTTTEIGRRTHLSSFDPLALGAAVVLPFGAFFRLIPLLMPGLPQRLVSAEQRCCIRIRNSRPSLRWISVGRPDYSPELSESRCRSPKRSKSRSQRTRPKAVTVKKCNCSVACCF